MYISFYTARQLRRIKDRLLWLGLFMACGGGGALIYNLLLRQEARWLWGAAAGIIALVGLYLVALGTDKVSLKNVFVAISPNKISYRLNFYSREHSLDWRSIAAMQFSDQCIIFDLQGGNQRSLHLADIESHNLASQVAVNLQLAALQHNITVNGIRFNVPGSIADL